ncbi:RlmE family RNA methyltransferase [Methanocaldococcus villosus]|uniref:RlmE family RNA methyltransferase n=1 Tax=Methanocaldococcus villosus TaxID=667126 RepID=UPI00036C479F|nr:SAM-dependent methyltransferase [Methanocaldococcus villosus]
MVKKNIKWIKKRKRDLYYKLAKKLNYRSRASFKLMQLNEKFNIIKPGNVVLDLGCAPGGWMQVAREIVGEEGFVIGIDLQKVKPFKYNNVIAIKGDFTLEENLKKIKELIPNEDKKVDVVISDASPNISGYWDFDHARSIDLCKTALQIATEMLKERGNFLAKVFYGDMVNDYKKLVEKYFERVYLSKPRASRKESSEIYIIAKRYTGRVWEEEDKIKREKRENDSELLVKKIKNQRKSFKL